MSDDELVEQILLGNEDAAEELIRRYYTAILRYCRACCESNDKAEDLTQETFLRLFTSLPKYTKQKKFRAFLYTIANHLCVDENRKLRQYSLVDGEHFENEHDAIRQAEDQAEVNRLLDTLPPEQRTAAILRYGEQLSFREIAEVTGCNLRTAQSRVRWAIKRMRQVWNDEG